MSFARIFSENKITESIFSSDSDNDNKKKNNNEEDNKKE